MNLADITPLILTLNEAPNVLRCLDRLGWAKRVVVLDSFSTDGTPALVRTHGNVHLAQRAFDDHTSQWNHGVALVDTPWVLSLDADYILPEDFATELEKLAPGAEMAAYFARFRYCVSGKPLRGSLYPPRAVLFRRDRCAYVNDGHTQLLRADGPAGQLDSVIWHDDRKSFGVWLGAQKRYTALEARHLRTTPLCELSFADRIRRWIFLAPGLVFLYTLLGKGLILDGPPGWHYVMQRTVAELLLSLRLLRELISGRAADGKPAEPSPPA